MLASMLDDGRVLVRILPDHPRFDELAQGAGLSRYHRDREGLEVVLGENHPRHAEIVRALRYAYNPNEPRDASGKWTHGALANSLHARHQELKQARVDAFREVKGEAEKAKEAAQTSFADAAAMSGNIRTPDEGDYTELHVELEDLFQDEYEKPSDQFDHLKEIEEKAREMLATDPEIVANPEATRKYEALNAQMDATFGQSEQLTKEFSAAKAANDTEVMRKNNEAWNAMLAEREKIKAAQKAIENDIGDGILPEHAAENKVHLKAIITNARQARQYLKIYVQHRKEMAAIKRGEPIETDEPPPAGDDATEQKTLFQREWPGLDDDFDGEIVPDRYARDPALRQAIREAAAETDTSPTELQRKVGNYKKGHVSIQGLDISIENPKGSIRSGEGKDGPWSVKMHDHYGYIRMHLSDADGDHFDCFIGPDPESETVFIVDQVDDAWQFDEHKALLGYNSKDEAKAAYLANYSPGWRGFGGITEMPMDEFKAWIADGDTGEALR